MALPMISASPPPRPQSGPPFNSSIPNPPSLTRPPSGADRMPRQVDDFGNTGGTPGLEFSEPELAYVSSGSSIRFGTVSSVRRACHN